MILWYVQVCNFATNWLKHTEICFDLILWIERTTTAAFWSVKPRGLGLVAIWVDAEAQGNSCLPWCTLAVKHPNFRNLPVVEGKKWKTQEWHLKVPSRPSICIIENITIDSRVWMWQNHTSLWIWTCYKMLETSLVISAFKNLHTNDPPREMGEPHCFTWLHPPRTGTTLAPWWAVRHR